MCLKYEIMKTSAKSLELGRRLVLIPKDNDPKQKFNQNTAILNGIWISLLALVTWKRN